MTFGLLTAAGFGTADFFAKLSTNRVGFLKTALFMQAMGTVLVLPFALTDASRLILHPWAVFVGIVLGVVNALATLCLYKGFQVGRVSIVSPIASAAPVVAILLAVVFLGETITEQRLAGISLVMLGIILVSIQDRQAEAFREIAKGTAYAIGFMILGGVLLFELKPVSHDLGAFLPVLMLRWVGTLVLAVPFLCREAKSRSLEKGALRLIIAVACLDTFANVAYNVGLIFGTVTIVSPLGGMFSPVTVLLAWLILKERLFRHQLFGFAAIVLGVATLGAFG
jgi:drug/metabolite transporter (DMT)-like permease